MGMSLEVVNSLVIAMVAAMVVGTQLYGTDGVSLPLWLIAAGMAASLLALSVTALLVHFFGDDASDSKLSWLLRIGYGSSTVFFLVFAYIVTSILHFDSAVCVCLCGCGVRVHVWWRATTLSFPCRPSAAS